MKIHAMILWLIPIISYSKSTITIASFPPPSMEYTVTGNVCAALTANFENEDLLCHIHVSQTPYDSVLNGNSDFAAVLSDRQYVLAEKSKYSESLRHVITLNRLAMHFYTTISGDDINLKSARGRVMSTGPEKTAQEHMTNLVLALSGINKTDFTSFQHKELDQLSVDLCGQNTDSVLFTDRLGHEEFQKMIGCGAKLFSLDIPNLDTIIEHNPYLLHITIPGGFYQDHLFDTETIGLGVSIISNKNVDNQKVQSFVQYLLDHNDLVQRQLTLFKHTIFSQIFNHGAQLDLHSGAKRAYGENNLLTNNE